MTQYFRILETITHEGARRIGEQALCEAAALGISIALVVIGRTGGLVLAETMDNAPPGSPEAALMKAKGAARYLAPTHRTAEFIKTLPAQLAHHALSLPDLCAFQGGMPITISGRVVGGLGIAGGSGEQDMEIAARAVAAVA